MPAIDAVVEGFEILETRAVVENQQRHDLTIGEAAFRPILSI
jgi:hypothetical protein